MSLDDKLREILTDAVMMVTVNGAGNNELSEPFEPLIDQIKQAFAESDEQEAV